MLTIELDIEGQIKLDMAQTISEQKRIIAAKDQQIAIMAMQINAMAAMITQGKIIGARKISEVFVNLN